MDNNKDNLEVCLHCENCRIMGLTGSGFCSVKKEIVRLIETCMDYVRKK